MITIFKNIKDIPQGKEYIELNDIFFNQRTVNWLDNRAVKIIEQIDGAKQISKYKIESKFNSVVLDIDRLSTGCKTVLNVLHFPDKVFSMKECGDNALNVLYNLKDGAVYSDYSMISFDFDEVSVYTGDGYKVIRNYEDLKEWWENEE